MKSKIAIIDYQLSNMFSLQNALLYLGYESFITSNNKDLMKSDIAILPGVGSFPEAIQKIQSLNLDKGIKEFIQTKRKFIGICLGMHLLFEESEEIKKTKGLQILQGKVKKIPQEKNYKVPHVGWNSVNTKNSFLNEFDKKNFYFVHSYYAKSQNNNIVASNTNYGKLNFTSMVLYQNIIACQFHPEKSSNNGLELLKKMITTL